MKVKRKIQGNKAAAIVWVVAGVLAFPFGWAYTIWFVVVCSIWANVFASWSTAEATDNRDVIERLRRIEEKIDDGNCNPNLSDRCVCMLRSRGTSQRSSSSPVESSSPGTTVRYPSGRPE